MVLDGRGDNRCALSSTSNVLFHTHSSTSDASRASWSSDAYTHYNVSLQRVDATASSDTVRKLVFIFSCKHGHESHHPIERPRGKTSNGTTNLLKTGQQCDTERGIVATQTESATSLVYSPAAHRAIIAMRTATSHRPFNIVNDKYYKMEVELLRPGTTVPSSSTVSRDLKLLYQEISRDVRAYFVV